MDKLSHTFGEQAVDPTEREQLIRRVFSRVAPRYDLIEKGASSVLDRGE